MPTMTGFMSLSSTLERMALVLSSQSSFPISTLALADRRPLPVGDTCEADATGDRACACFPGVPLAAVATWGRAACLPAAWCLACSSPPSAPAYDNLLGVAFVFLLFFRWGRKGKAGEEEGAQK